MSNTSVCLSICTSSHTSKLLKNQSLRASLGVRKSSGTIPVGKGIILVNQSNLNLKISAVHFKIYRPQGAKSLKARSKRPVNSIV